MQEERSVKYSIHSQRDMRKSKSIARCTTPLAQQVLANELRMPKQLSSGEELFAMHCKAYKLTPEREYRFCPPRKWSSDFAFPEQMILVEIEGGTWNGGRHNLHQGFSKDLDKYNRAATMGYAVLRFTSDMVVSGCAIDTVMEALKCRNSVAGATSETKAVALNAAAE